MPLSHTCAACGMELCGVRAAPDPVYALPVVVCPRCGMGCVRRRHPQMEAWRGFHRLSATLGRLFLQLALLLVFTLLFSAFLHSLRIDLSHQSLRLREAWADPEATIAVRRVLVRSGLIWNLTAWVCYSTCLGVWLVAGFAHWRAWRVPLAWTGAMLAIAVGSTAIDYGAHVLDALVSGHPWTGVSIDVSRYMQVFVLAVASLALALPGAAVGLARRAGARGAARRRFRKRLARLRRRRQG